MKRFTEAYAKARDVVQKQEFEPAWQKFLTSSRAKILFGDKGFEKVAASSPGLVRTHIGSLVKEGSCSAGDVIYAAACGGKPPAALNERAATLKMVKHLYRINQKGSQEVWVYSPPKDHVGWVFDELAGDAATVKSRLSKDEEIFSQQEMNWMSSALALALKICEDVRVKLPTKKARAVVKRWFMDEDCGDDEMEQACNTLTDGFKKIAVACSSPVLVFTDYPDWRSHRDKYFGAAFRGGEGGGFPVVYLEGAFTRLTGNSGKAWLCAETIIHELSHHEISTRDHRYDVAGLKPNTAAFAYDKAIDNADSWGYFALDLAGYLSKADFTKTWK